MTDTPRTDNAYEYSVGDPDFFTDEGWRMARKLERELVVTEKLLSERQKLLDAIPECHAHGKCVPHALEWIEKSKNKLI